jgi:hypothetical protein
MSGPKRIQRKRSKGWRMPQGAIYVGRPSRWGNPFKAIGGVTKATCVEQFRRRMFSSNQAAERESIVKTFRGKTLACWCPLVDADGIPVPCHADVLLEIANNSP